MKRVKTAAVVVLATCSSLAAAASFTVSATGNSTAGGVGLSTFELIAGQQFSVSVDVNDLWSAGPLPRWSNAGGLVKNVYYAAGATDSEVSNYADGTQIGSAFDSYVYGGLTAPYGTLVGQIGNGNLFSIGTNYSGTAGSTGMLKLYYFDSNNADNAGSVVANVTAVPEPEAYAMLLAGLGLVGVIARRKKSVR